MATGAASAMMAGMTKMLAWSANNLVFPSQVNDGNILVRVIDTIGEEDMSHSAPETWPMLLGKKFACGILILVIVCFFKEDCVVHNTVVLEISLFNKYCM